MGEALDATRAMIDAWNEDRLEDIYGFWDPDIVVRPDPGFPEGAAFGYEQARRFYEAQRDAFGRAGFTVVYEHDLGDRVLARIDQHVASRSGLEGEFHWSVITTVRDGKAIMIEFFLDEQKGLRAVGLAGV
jgi:ketosteroid isomerase-like protein